MKFSRWVWPITSQTPLLNTQIQNPERSLAPKDSHELFGKIQKENRPDGTETSGLSGR